MCADLDASFDQVTVLRVDVSHTSFVIEEFVVTSVLWRIAGLFSCLGRYCLIRNLLVLVDHDANV